MHSKNELGRFLIKKISQIISFRHNKLLLFISLTIEKTLCQPSTTSYKPDNKKQYYNLIIEIIVVPLNQFYLMPILHLQNQSEQTTIRKIFFNYYSKKYLEPFAIPRASSIIFQLFFHFLLSFFMVPQRLPLGLFFGFQILKEINE